MRPRSLLPAFDEATTLDDGFSLEEDELDADAVMVRVVPVFSSSFSLLKLKIDENTLDA